MKRTYEYLLNKKKRKLKSVNGLQKYVRKRPKFPRICGKNGTILSLNAYNSGSYTKGLCTAIMLCMTAFKIPYSKSLDFAKDIKVHIHCSCPFYFFSICYRYYFLVICCEETACAQYWTQLNTRTKGALSNLYTQL